MTQHCGKARNVKGRKLLFATGCNKGSMSPHSTASPPVIGAGHPNLEGNQGTRIDKRGEKSYATYYNIIIIRCLMPS